MLCGFLTESLKYFSKIFTNHKPKIHHSRFQKSRDSKYRYSYSHTPEYELSLSWLQEEEQVQESTKSPNVSLLIAGFYRNDERLKGQPLYEFVKPQINDTANGANVQEMCTFSMCCDGKQLNIICCLM